MFVLQITYFDHKLMHYDSVTLCHVTGLFISNGPGNPETAPELIENMRTVINQNRKQPIFGEYH